MHEDFIPAWEQRLVGAFIRPTLFRRRRSNGWQVPDRLEPQRFTFEGNNGARLAGRYFPVPTSAPPRGIVVLAHPDRRYAQHWFVREGWIDWLHAHGYAAFTFDFVQYGASRGGSTYLYQDVVHACRKAQGLAPGVPVHLVGISLGAFAAAVASPELDFVDSLTLESPYPDFTAWYQGGEDGWGIKMAHLFERIFPRTAGHIRADLRIAETPVPRILIAASRDDTTTDVGLTRQVAAGAPLERTTYMEMDGVGHLAFFERDDYRAALLAHLEGPLPGVAPAAPLAHAR